MLLCEVLELYGWDLGICELLGCFEAPVSYNDDVFLVDDYRLDKSVRREAFFEFVDLLLWMPFIVLVVSFELRDFYVFDFHGVILKRDIFDSDVVGWESPVDVGWRDPLVVVVLLRAS